MPGVGKGPGRDAPSAPISPQKREVERMANIIAADIARLEDKTIEAVLPALLEAREELRRELAIWLAKVDGDETFTAQDLRRGLVAIESALEKIGQMRADLQTQILAASTTAATLAADHLREQLARFGAKFGESIRPTQISTAAIIARAKHEIIPRIRTSSKRYVGAVREDMRRQLAVGLARGETFTQMTSRLRRLGGPRGLVALRGVVGEPGAVVEDIAEGLFNRYRHWAERVVRTEVINAYNVEHIAAVEELNEDLEEDEQEPLLLKWDSSPDKRTCLLCRALDGRVTKVGKPFAPGVDHPPRHPNCRCVAVAWHPSWGDIEGEHKPTSAAPGVKLSSPAKQKRSRKILTEEERARKRALAEISREKKRPMATSFHPNMTDPRGLASSSARQAFEDRLEQVLGKRVPLEELSHGFAVPDAFEARLDTLRPEAIAWKIYEKSTGKYAGHLIRDFGLEHGKPYVHHALLKIEPEFQGSKISDTVNGNAFRHYEKWGVKRIDITAAWVGRYAWARLGFRFKYPSEILRAFERYVDRMPQLAPRRVELLQIAREYVKDPQKLASWDIDGRQFPDEWNEGGKTVHFGKAFLLSRDVDMWDGYMDIDRKNAGYLTAITRAHVVPRRK